MKIIVLGAGLVGRPMAIDLAKDRNFNVAVADIDKNNLDKIPSRYKIQKVIKDISKRSELRSLIKDYDIVLSAVPGFLGFNTLKEIINAGKNVVDISFFAENPFELDELAKKKNVTAFVDCGVAPGMSNLLAGYVNTKLEQMESLLIFVGGLPVERVYPFEYKAGFSPIDVIEEYVRPARYIENGNMVIRPALSDPELIDFPGIGTLEAFNSDGLRTLAYTLNAPNMKEKTLRYPGHIEKMKMLREIGLFDNNEIDVKGIKIKPIDLTARLLFPLWQLHPNDKEFTVMKMIIEGYKKDKKYRYTYFLLDYHNDKTNVHSMARTTGYTATMILRMFSKGMFNRKGICPPEFIGQDPRCVKFILSGLKKREIDYHETIEVI